MYKRKIEKRKRYLMERIILWVDAIRTEGHPPFYFERYKISTIGISKSPTHKKMRPYVIRMSKNGDRFILR
jgi:hypothetical protein